MISVLYIEYQRYGTYSDFQRSQNEPVLVSEASSTGHTADQYWFTSSTYRAMPANPIYTEYPSLSKRIPIPPFHYTIRRRGDKFSPLKKKAPQLE